MIAAIAFLRSELPSTPIGIIGSSLGGAATLLAVPDARIDALVTEAVYPTIEGATRNRLEMRLGALGRAAAPLLLVQIRSRIGGRAADLRPIDKIANVGCPVFVIGGAVDQHTKRHETVQLYEAAQEPKRLWIVPGAAHVDLHRFATTEYEKRVLAFLQSAFTAAN